MTDPTIETQYWYIGESISPTFESVESTEYVTLSSTAFIVCYNDSATIPAACVLSPPIGLCSVVSLPVGGEEVFIGPFDLDLYTDTTITLSFPTTADVYIAALDYLPGINVDVLDWVNIYGQNMSPEAEAEVLTPTVSYSPVGCLPSVIEADSEVLTMAANIATNVGITSIASGLWSATTTWIGGVVPIDGNSVTIATGHTVYFDSDQIGYATGLGALVVNGTLEFVTASPVSETALIPVSLTPCLSMKTLIPISGTGTIRVGNSLTDPITAPAVGSSERAIIRWVGAPPSELITTAHASFNGWYDTVNATTLAQAQVYGDTTITLTDTMSLLAGDIIAIGAAVDQGEFIEVANGRYTVSSYDAGSKIVTLTEPLEDERLLGDPIAHVSRPIKIEATVTLPVTDVVIFQTKLIPYDNFVGVWVTGGSHIVDGLTGTSEITACTVEGNRKPALYDCPGEIDISKMTVLNANTNAAQGALLDNMSGRIFIEDCTVIDGEVGVSSTGGLKMNRCTLQNISTACVYNLDSSLLKGCNITGSILGISNGGHNRYINCNLANNVIDAMGEYEAEAYNLILGNPDSLGLPIGAEQKIWYANKSFYHNGVSTEHRVWCVGGYGLTQNVVQYAGVSAWQFAIQTANKPIFWDVPFLAVEGETFTISAAMQKDFLGGTVSFQILDPGFDPLHEFGDAVLSETILPDELSHWRVLSVTYTPDSTRSLVARIFAQNVVAEGNVYAVISGLDAVKITGDQYIVPM